MKKEEQEALTEMLDSLGCLAYLKDLVDQVYLLTAAVEKVAKQLENFTIDTSTDD